MEDDLNDNKIVQNEPGVNYEFKYNFVNTPWDDRTRKSKVGIVSLLLAIFLSTMACVTNNFVMHFASSYANKFEGEAKCNLMKVDEYKFAARIHSVETQELLCIGAVLSPTSVLTNGICVKSAPLRMRLGSPSDPRCKKGFSVDIIEQINHDGIIPKQMVLLSSYEKMNECKAKIIKLGDTVDYESKAYIIGRPTRGGRSLSRQPANLVDPKTISPEFSIDDINLKKTICVTDPGTCPVRAGDLLVQNGYLLGLASVKSNAHYATNQSKLVCFADLRKVREALRQLDPEIFE